MRIPIRRVFPAAVGTLLLAAAASVPATQTRPATPFDALHFRDIGPAATSGRLHDVQMDPKDPATLYVAAATGGLWKSTNKGVTWKPIFERQPDSTSGALAIFPRDPKIRVVREIRGVRSSLKGAAQQRDRGGPCAPRATHASDDTDNTD
jgi:hypothetical protein